MGFTAPMKTTTAAPMKTRKTHVTYFVSDNKGQNYNGAFQMRAKASTEDVKAATIAHAAKVGFVGHQIEVTATGCAEPMLSHTILA